MRIGDLDQKVVFIADGGTRGANSKAIKPWATSTTVATVWGNLRPTGGGRETFGQPNFTVSQSEYILTVYARTDITPKMRAQIDTRTFEILSVANVRDTKLMMSMRLAEVI